jgi:hypothetical protein
MKREVSVTTVLKQLQDFGNIDPAIIENKGKIGTDVHKAIEAYVKQDWYPLDEPRREAYFGSYKLWKDRERYECKHTELELMDENLWLIGHVDAVIRNKENGQLFLLDYKTSAKESIGMEGLNIWCMQAHMYYHLLRANGYNVSPVFYFLQLRTKKKDEEHFPANPKLYAYEYDPEVMDRCIQEVNKYWNEYDNSITF